MQDVDIFDFFKQRGVDFTKTELYKRCKEIKIPEEGAFVAGGALRRTIFDEKLGNGDIDYFFMSYTDLSDFHKDAKKLYFNRITNSSLNYTHKFEYSVSENGNFTQFRQVQAVQLFMGRIDHIIPTFDFTICRFAWSRNRLIFDDRALWDLAEKKLVCEPEKLKAPKHTLYRVHKYSKLDYKMDKKIFDKLCEVVRNTPDEPMWES